MPSEYVVRLALELLSERYGRFELRCNMFQTQLSTVKMTLNLFVLVISIQSGFCEILGQASDDVLEPCWFRSVSMEV